MRKRRSSAAPLLCRLVSVLLALGRGGAAGRDAPAKACPSSTGVYHRADVWGDGVDAKMKNLGEKNCFLVSPVDRVGSRLDKDCKPPSTFWLLQLRSRDGSVQLAGDIFHISHEGFHMACYRLMEAGQYDLHLYLSATNYANILSASNATVDDFPSALIFNTTINAQLQRWKVNNMKDNYLATLLRQLTAVPIYKVMQAIDPEKHKAMIAALPICNPSLLSAGRNEGRWISNLWYPFDCRVNRITPNEVLQCLAGKRLLIAGDSQLWYLFAELMNYLGKRDRCLYTNEYKDQHGWMASLRSFKAHLKGPVPYMPGSDLIAVHTTEYGTGALATFYGTTGNGFGVGRLQSTAAPPGSNEGHDEHSVKVTYVSHGYSKDPLFKDWMTDHRRPGPLANAFAPFDYVLAASGLHDLLHCPTVEQYAKNLEMEFIPSLRFFVPNMSVVTWAGLWASQETLKATDILSLSNNARGFAFEEAARRIINDWDAYWLGLRFLSSPRGDLCPDGLHYSWPVSIATIELWLGSICPASVGWEPDSVRC